MIRSVIPFLALAVLAALAAVSVQAAPVLYVNNVAYDARPEGSGAPG